MSRVKEERKIEKKKKKKEEEEKKKKKKKKKKKTWDETAIPHEEGQLIPYEDEQGGTPQGGYPRTATLR